MEHSEVAVAPVGATLVNRPDGDTTMERSEVAAVPRGVGSTLAGGHRGCSHDARPDLQTVLICLEASKWAKRSCNGPLQSLLRRQLCRCDGHQ